MVVHIDRDEERCPQCWSFDGLHWERRCESGSTGYEHVVTSAKTGETTRHMHPEVPACEHGCHDKVYPEEIAFAGRMADH